MVGSGGVRWPVASRCEECDCVGVGSWLLFAISSWSSPKHASCYGAYMAGFRIICPITRRIQTPEPLTEKRGGRMHVLGPLPQPMRWVAWGGWQLGAGAVITQVLLLFSRCSPRLLLNKELEGKESCLFADWGCHQVPWLQP